MNVRTRNTHLVFGVKDSHGASTDEFPEGHEDFANSQPLFKLGYQYIIQIVEDTEDYLEFRVMEILGEGKVCHTKGDKEDG